MVNATPGVNRVMNYQLEEVDDSCKIKIVEDDTIVFNRPKFFVGSSGAVWASEYMRLRYEKPRLFLAGMDDSKPTPDVSLFIRLNDQLRFYKLATDPKDVANIASKVDCPHRRYEISRAMAVNRTLMKVQEQVQDLQPNLPAEQLNDISTSVDELYLKCLRIIDQLHTEMNKTTVLDSIVLFSDQCQDLFTKIGQLIPPMKSRIHEFTDAGPGVGVTNLDVRLCMAQIIAITDVDYFVRHHLSNGDSSYNEVERCQSYVGDAICDGGPIQWEYKECYEGLSGEQLDGMTLEELEESEHQRMKYNAFKVCDEITLRTDGAPAPGGYMKAFTSEGSDDMFFCNEKYAWDYLHASEQRKSTLPGRNYFDKVKTFGENHCKLGEKHIEFIKFSCKIPDKCEYCSTHPWVGPPCTRIPQPYPDYEADGYHYKSVFDTPTQIDGKERAIDDFQPRKQAKDYMAKGNLGNDEEVKQFSDTFIASEVLVKKYVDHLKRLEINKTKRAEKQQLKKQQNNNKMFEDYDWVAMFNNGLLKSLNISDLNKYLSHYGMQHSLKLKKAEKVRVIQGHIASQLNVFEVDAVAQENSSESDDSDSSSSADESSEDMVLNDTLAGTSESEASEKSESEENVEDLFTTTRSGRITTNWRISKYR